MRKLALLFLLLLLMLSPCAAQNAPVGYGQPSQSLASYIQLKTAAGSLIDFQVNTTTAGGWIMVLDQNTAPSNGAVTPIKWYQVGANNTYGVAFEFPLLFLNGAVVACSTTGPFTLTLTQTCTFSGEVK